jgi:anthranilate phosphoribosyltransferase
MKEILLRLYQSEFLSKEEARNILLDITYGKINQAQTASFMSAFLMRNISVEEISGFREALYLQCLDPGIENTDAVDIVGTGGDNKNTFNISTLSCFIASGADCRIIKHGNYGVTSVSGSSTVLEQLGYQFKTKPDQLNKELDVANLTFLHAPFFHPALKQVAAIRKDLGVRSLFNLLGPLVNPAKPKHKVLGVYNLEIERLYHYLLQGEGESHCILHSTDGYDEISLTGAFKKTTLFEEQYFEPEELHLNRATASDLYAGETAEDAATVFLTILNGKGTEIQKQVCSINAAAAISLYKNISLTEALAEARESLDSGKALQQFKKLTTN